MRRFFHLKIVGIILPMVLTLLMLPLGANAASTGERFDYGGLWYTVLDESSKTVACSGNYSCSGHVKIPSTVYYDDSQSFKVTAIAVNAFSNSSKITGLELPNTVTTIRPGAFQLNKTINSIKLGNSLSSIGHYAFKGCENLKSITLPPSLKSIGDYAFKGCENLKSITLPSSLKSIGDCAFSGSGLESLDIVSSITEIGYEAFSECSNLKNVSIQSTVKTVRKGVFKDCTNLKSATINSPVIEYQMFYGCTSLKEVQIGNSVTSINAEAFYGCTALTDITIPNSVKIIDNFVFSGCTNLGSVTLGNSVEEIGYHIFSDTKITKINLPKSLNHISTMAFIGCGNLEEITVDEENNTYTSIDGVLFSKDLSTLVAFPSGRGGAYEIPYGVTKLEPGSFGYCDKLTDVIIPSSVLEIGDIACIGSFVGCIGLTKIVIPNSVKIIWAECFAGCSNLSYIELPSSISFIQSDAFYKCPVSVIYYITDTPVKASENVFDEQVYQNAILYCAQENMSKYLETTPWNKFVNIRGVETEPFAYTILSEESATVAVKRGILSPKGEVEIPSQATLDGKAYTVTEVEANGFENCAEITSVILPATISKIGESAFDGCAKMSEFIVAADNDAYASVDGMLLNGDKTELLICPQGKSDGVAIPETVEAIAPRAFFKCDKLDKIELPKSVEKIGEYAFSGCSGLVIVDIPGSVKEIGDYAFAECENIANLFYITDMPVKADRNVFTDSAYKNATLFYSSEHLNQYYRTIPWCFFKNIQGMSGIEEAMTDGNADGLDVYNTQGVLVRTNATATDIESLPSGLYIIGGKKVIVK